MPSYMKQELSEQEKGYILHWGGTNLYLTDCRRLAELFFVRVSKKKKKWNLCVYEINAVKNVTMSSGVVSV